MQTEFSFIQKAEAVAKYAPQGVRKEGNKLWFTYVNKAGSIIPAYYDYATRAFKSVVHGKQYGKGRAAVRNRVARPVIDGALGE